MEPVSTDEYISMALKYLFRKGTAEVKEFNDGILYSKNRAVAELDCIHTSELNINLGSLGIKFHAPYLDRYSPLSYSITWHVHWKLASHRGVETHNRIALEYGTCSHHAGNVSVQGDLIGMHKVQHEEKEVPGSQNGRSQDGAVDSRSTFLGLQGRLVQAIQDICTWS